MRPGLERRRQRAEQEQQARALTLPSDVYVVCERGVPVAAAVTEGGARAAAIDIAKTDVRMHLVPLVDLP